jgi:hypothetical protein
MKSTFLLVTLLIVTTIPAAPVAAQAQPDDQPDELPVWFQNATDTDRCESPQVIDNSTVICSSALVDDGRYAEIVIRSDHTQRVTLTDGAGLMTAGPINRKTFTVREGEMNTLRLRVTRVDGFAGVTIDTGTVLYGLPLETSSTLVGPPWGPSDAQLAALAAALSTAGVSAFVVLRTVYGKTEEPERIA